MKKYLLNIVAIFFLILATSWAGKGLFKYPIYQTHDLDHHLVRAFDAMQTLKEGSFPLRWAGRLNFECGSPIYNFFNPLFYYISSSLTYITNDIVTSIKIIGLASMLLGSLFLYLWLKNETDNFAASIAGALIYLYAPYRFVLIFVRGSPEYLAYAILPAVFYFYSLAFKKKKSHFILNLFIASVFGGLLSISHNVVFLLSIPMITIYLFLKIYETKDMINGKFLYIVFSYLSIFGFGSFFIFPALIEMKFTQISVPVFLYHDHFPTFRQIIYSTWGYGDSAVGNVLDGFSFQLGISNWIALVLGLSFLIYYRRSIFNNLWIFVLTLFSVVFIYLDLSVSSQVWEKLKILQTIQFPWRILGITVFALSTLYTVVISKVKNKFLYFLLLLLVPLIAFFENRNHLLAQPVYKDTLIYYEKVNSLQYERNSLTQVQDNVLPQGKLAQCSPKTPVLTTEEAEKVLSKEIQRGSTYGSLKFNLDKSKPLGNHIIVNLDYFPDIFQFKLNGSYKDYSNCDGRVCFSKNDFSDGENSIEWRVVQTPVERLFNIVTAIFISIWLVILFLSKFQRHDSQKS